MTQKLERHCQENDQRKSRECNQTPGNEPSAVVSCQFRHFKPPLFFEKRRRGAWSSPRAVTAADCIKRPGALRELSPQQSTGPNQPRGWLSKQCVRKLAEFQQRGETVNRSLLGVPIGGPGAVSRVETSRRGLAVRSGDLRAVRLPLQLVRWLTCSASELKGNCDQHDKSKNQECHQASHCQSGTIASDQFRHFSPPIVLTELTRGPGSPVRGLDRSRGLAHRADRLNRKRPASGLRSRKETPEGGVFKFASCSGFGTGWGSMRRFFSRRNF